MPVYILGSYCLICKNYRYVLLVIKNKGLAGYTLIYYVVMVLLPSNR